MIVALTPSVREDAVSVSSRLRAADLRELCIATLRDPCSVLLDALSLPGECWTIWYSGLSEPVALGGVRDSGMRFGIPWFVATPQVHLGSLALLREADRLVKTWLERYAVLVNLVDVRNTIHRRWLALLGFTFHPAVTIHGHPFIPFSQELHRV